MDELTFGVDPGLNGACVGLIDGEPQVDLVVRARKYAVKNNSFSFNRLDVDAFYDDLQNLKCIRGATVYIEEPFLKPGKSLVTSKTQVIVYGQMDAVVRLLGAKRIIQIQPTEWKKKYGLLKPKGITKERASCDRARELFPKFDLMVKDADIAEALLIGRYGYRYKRGEA